MPIRIDNLIILFGLFALAIPIVLHLLQRRRHEVLDWGAMQFLPESISMQRRRWLDEILLMLVRMAVIGLLVFALATPIATSSWLAALGNGAARDAVIVIDGSYSMDVRISGQTPPWQDALRWMRDHTDSAPGESRFSVLMARRPPVFLQEGFTSDLDDAPDIQPVGNTDMPRALALAWRHLKTKSSARTKEIIVLTDGQRHGWVNGPSLAALDALGSEWHADQERMRADGAAVPSLRVIKLGAELPKSVPNYALAPLTMSRTVAKVGQTVNVRSALNLAGFAKFQKPRTIYAHLYGQPLQKLDIPDHADLKKGQIPLHVPLRFDREGQHLVSLIVDTEDALAADNRQHAVVDVVKELRLLLVDGDARLSPDSSTYFLQRALAATHVTQQPALNAADFARPSVVVLADVPHLTAEQIDALDRFLADGGGLLIMLGERASEAQAFYNDRLNRQGQGWLPVKLAGTASSADGVQPDPRTFAHPALDLFRAGADGGTQVRVAKWWKAHVSPRDHAMPLAFLSNGDPFLIEKQYKNGRVILCTIPPDRRWDSNFPGAWEYPVIMNELVYYLAGSHSSKAMLQGGEPIRLTPPDLAQRLTLHAPEGAPKKIVAKETPWTYENTGAVGVYRVDQAPAKTWWFVTSPDLGESDLARCTDADWQKVRECLPVVWNDESNQPSFLDDAERIEIWWLLLLGVLALLCVEVWMTRRLALARGC